MVQSAMLTPCGHSFCHDCIVESLTVSVYCPECRAVISFADLQPNFALDSMTRQQAVEEAHPATLNELNRRIAMLMEQRHKLANDQAIIDGQMLVEFLQTHWRQKQQDLKRLQDEVSQLEYDLSKAMEKLSRAKERVGRELEGEPEEVEAAEEEPTPASPLEGEPEVPVSRKRKQHGVEVSTDDPVQVPSDYLRRMEELKAELANSYQQIQRDDNGLDLFARRLRSLCRLSRMKTVSNLRMADVASNASSSSNIISSIEFDRDGQVFVTAGVAKRIRFYRYSDVISTAGQVQVPLREVSTRAKLSSVSWNQYLDHQLAGGDYEGIATVWDVARGGQVVCTFEEHEKRIWSVDYSRVDPLRLATGSDDAHVRVWSGRAKRSTMVIDGKANVCSVAFHPTQAHLLAFGSADHHVHIYDLRSTLKPLKLLKGHRKAVSYVKWMGEDEVVSASTDCQLRLWKLGEDGNIGECKQVFAGHVNEKNFVGLAVHQDLIACGSENNSLYCYHRDLPSPLASLKFTQTCPVSGLELEADGQHFVSAVCWRNQRPDLDAQLVVANSQGAVKIVQLE